MKLNTLIIFVILTVKCLCHLNAQGAPEKFNYQVSLRDLNGQIMANKSVYFKISILENSATGILKYSENQVKSTNAYGVAALMIGEGTNKSGSMSSLNLLGKNYFIKVEAGSSAGNLSIISESQLISVPYALVANEANKASGTFKLNPSQLEPAGASTGQVLKWNGQSWSPLSDNGASYSAGSGISINNNQITNTGDLDALNDLTINTDFGGDVSGKYNTLQIAPNAIGTAEIANGAVTGAKIAQGGAANGQVLKWNGQIWAPLADNGASYSAGLGITLTNNQINNTGDLDALNDLTINTDFGGDVSGKYNTLQIAPNAIGSAEIANGSVTGAKIAQGGAANGQVLKWNGQIWAPLADNGASYSAGTGISINNNQINNTGDLDATNDVLTTTNHSGEVTGVYNNLQIANNAISTAKLVNGSVTGTKIAQGGAGIGQVLKWNGTQWTPSNDSDGGGGSSNLFGDVTGTLSKNLVTKLQNRPLSANAPVSGQVLKWLGNEWTPGTDNNSTPQSFWNASGNNIINNNSGGVLANNGLASTFLTSSSVDVFNDTQTSIGLIDDGGATNTIRMGIGNYSQSTGTATLRAGLEFLFGNYTVFGQTKSFVMDHPLAQEKVIIYSCIEGPEAAAYTRGTSELKNGRAEIIFADEFKLIINPNTLTIHLTPNSLNSKGMAVIQKSENGFIVGELFEGNGSYSFDWEVKGVRKGFEDYKVVRNKSDFQVKVPFRGLRDR